MDGWMNGCVSVVYTLHNSGELGAIKLELDGIF